MHITYSINLSGPCAGMPVLDILFADSSIIDIDSALKQLSMLTPEWSDGVIPLGISFTNITEVLDKPEFYDLVRAIVSDEKHTVVIFNFECVKDPGSQMQELLCDISIECPIYLVAHFNTTSPYILDVFPEWCLGDEDTTTYVVYHINGSMEQCETVSGMVDLIQQLPEATSQSTYIEPGHFTDLEDMCEEARLNTFVNLLPDFHDNDEAVTNVANLCMGRGYQMALNFALKLESVYVGPSDDSEPSKLAH